MTRAEQPFRPCEHAVPGCKHPRRRHLAILAAGPWVDPTAGMAPRSRGLSRHPILAGRVSQAVEVYRDQHVAVVGLAAQDVTETSPLRRRRVMTTIAERSSLRRFDIDSRTNRTVFSR
jgi:hypothetical protein